MSAVKGISETALRVTPLRMLLVVSLMGAVPATAQVTAGDLRDQAVEWLQEYIQIDTVSVNPIVWILASAYRYGIRRSANFVYSINVLDGRVPPAAGCA